MLVSSSRWERGSASVATTLVLGQRNRTHIVRRRGLMFDTRFLVGAGAPRPCGTLHFLLEGELVLGSGARLQAPVAHALLEEEFDHRRSTAESFRLEGSPTVVIDILLPASSFLVPLGIGAGPCVCTDEVWAAARALAAADDVDASYRAFVLAVRRARWVTDAVVSDANTAMPAHIERLWRTMAAFYQRQDTAGFLDAVADLSGLSLRQIARDWRTGSFVLSLGWVSHDAARVALAPGNAVAQLRRTQRWRSRESRRLCLGRRHESGVSRCKPAAA